MAECRKAHCPPPPPYIPTGPLHPNFSDLGKVPRDLLTKGFSPGHVLSFSCLGPKSSVLTSTATIQTASTVGVTTASVVEGCRKHELSFSTLNNQITGISSFTDLAISGLTATVEASAPGGRQDSKITLQYVNENANISAKVSGTQPHPEVELSLGLGTSCLSAGGSALFDARTQRIMSARAGIGYQNESLSAAVLFDPLTDRYIDAYFSRVISPELQLGAILSHQIDQGFGSAKVGGSYHWDKQSTVKWRIDSHGMAAGLLQYTPNTRITFGLLTDINLKDLGAKPQIGLSMSLKA
ncbi:unnamed protein product [Sphagnum compactum]